MRFGPFTMTTWFKKWHSLSDDTDGLAQYRARIGTQVSALSALLLLPFSVLQWWQGRPALALLFAVTLTVLAINAWTLGRSGRPLIPFGPVVLGLTVAVCVSIESQGVNGIFWAYPVLFVGFFVLPRRMANLLGLFLLLAVSGTVWHTLGPQPAGRVLATLSLIFVMINVVLNVVGDLQNALRHQAITDPLTGAYNRRHLQHQLKAVSAQPADGHDVLLVVDIDHFKRINDTYGHDMGDEVLRKLVDILSARKRRADQLFRIGGEEFVLLLPNTTHEDALHVAESLRLRIEQAALLPTGGEPVTVSIGVGERQPGQTPEAWLKQVDEALYQAKRQGRNRVFTAPTVAPA